MAPTAYDARRPRIPVELASLIDGARGHVPFNRWVEEALKQALGGQSENGAVSTEGSAGSRVAPSLPPSSEPRPTAQPAPARAPRPVSQQQRYAMERQRRLNEGKGKT